MHHPIDTISRRRFLGASALAAAVPGLGIAASATSGGALPRDVGRKFNVDGTVRRFNGNTFVGHVDQQGKDYPVFDALLDIYREFPAQSFASKIALTPPSSYHITVFGALNEEDRGKARWPRALAPGLSLADVDRIWLERLQARPRLAQPRFEFGFATPALLTEGAPNVPLVPANDATARRLAALRDELSDFTGIRDANHERYKYHLTFGYIHRLLTGHEAHDLKAATERWVAHIAARGGTIAIPSVQFCSLRDMYAFRVLHEL